MKVDMCTGCRNKSIGCKKFCSSYKSSYEEYIRNITIGSRIRQGEKEVLRRMKEDKHENK